MMMITRKTALLMMSACLTAALAGCGQKESGSSAAPAATPAASAAASPVSTASPAASPAAAGSHGAHWSYTGDTGPSHWGEMGAENAACANGTEQSPIDIDLAKAKVNQTLEDIQTVYKPTAFTVVNNGHTVQANAADSSNVLRIQGKDYNLVQFHFHLPSEHEFNGKSFDMELHLVHKNAAGELAVLGVMLKGGKEQAALAELWSKMPAGENMEGVKLEKPVDLAALLPADKASFRYNGSLTTPPCSQSVKWTVLEQPVEVSPAQIEAFRKLFPNNARPVQELKGRTVETDKDK
ncbi:carbonic anhydrase [Gorillibacterium sp. sgz5001074]|uniref:carbonic anhydrase n=1 Tax=Gorillibacterium sp. sgz5001074 TaxID=3446695 RepID=UPI003F6621DD